VEESADSNFITSNVVNDNADDGIDIETNNNTVFGNKGNRNGSNGLEADRQDLGQTGNLFPNNVFNFDGEHGVCAEPGTATNGGGNGGVGNGTPPDVDFNNPSC
ncbi:MAG TPA: hypothetical protein VKK81_01270, partial [Candidatus Binatia bacterium]|nr:hypothetical protein [Candidatus Binatia bacterium]